MNTNPIPKPIEDLTNNTKSVDILGDIFDTTDNNGNNNNNNNNNNNKNKDDFDNFFGENINTSPIKNLPNIHTKFTNIPYKTCVTVETQSAKQILTNIKIE